MLAGDAVSPTGHIQPRFAHLYQPQLVGIGTGAAGKVQHVGRVFPVMVFLSHGVIPISYRKIRGHRHTVLLTPTVGLYEVPHTKNVMAITKKRFYPRALNVISARLECIHEARLLERQRRGRLQRSFEKIAATRKPGASGGNWSVGYSHADGGRERPSGVTR